MSQLGTLGLVNLPQTLHSQNSQQDSKSKYLWSVLALYCLEIHSSPHLTFPPWLFPLVNLPVTSILPLMNSLHRQPFHRTYISPLTLTGAWPPPRPLAGLCFSSNPSKQRLLISLTTTLPTKHAHVPT